MRTLLIAALVLAAGCDATRRDPVYCNQTHQDCKGGFACNLKTGMCESLDAAGTDTPLPGAEVGAPTDVMPSDTPPVGAEAGKDVSIGEVGPPVVDGPTSEGPARGEAGGVDTGGTDGPRTCGGPADCTSSLLPYCVNGQCVACKASSQCSNLGGTPYCSTQNACVSCAQAPSDFCSTTTPNLPVCDSNTGRCVECATSSQCNKDPAKPICLAKTSTCVECEGNGGCTKDPAKAFCVANTCQGCNAPGASASGGSSVDGGTAADGGSRDGGVLPACIAAKPVCAISGSVAGQCVECVDNSACTTATRPICTNNACTACTSDSQCTASPGICLFHLSPGGGRCATEAEAIFVQNDPAICVTSGTSTAAKPFCQPQTGMDAVSTSKRLVVITGPTALDPWKTPTTWMTAQQVSVIGRKQAVIAAGATQVGINITSGSVYIRGLTVQGMGELATQPGIVVEPGAILGLNRSYVMQNAGGLQVKDGAGYDIANSVFANNQPGKVGFDFGGVYLGRSTSSSGPHRFWFSTVANNQQTGVVCANSSQELTGMLFYANVTADFLNCSLAIKNDGITQSGVDSKWQGPPREGSDTGDPAVSTSKPFHLTAISKCRDYVDPALAHPMDDIDGELRPKPATGKLDCGADEF